MHKKSSITNIILQFVDDKNISPMVDSPKAQNICTATPNLCLDLPRHCSFMNEKHKVIAGFVPKPAKKYPSPTILGESETATIRTPIVPTAHERRMEIFLPQLSAR